MKILCYDMGGTYIKYGVIENNEFIFSSKVPTLCHNSQSELINQYLELTKEMLNNYPDICGVGVSTAGAVNYHEGVICAAPASIPVFQDFDFKKLFKENFNLDCFVDNDVNSFAAAELNEKNPYKNFIVMTIGTGIGGAVIVNNQLWRGVNYNAGEIGRMIINGKSYEDIAATSVLVKQVKNLGLNIENGIDVFKLYDEKNEQVVPLVEDFFNNLVIGIANVIYMFNPEAIFIGGGISKRDTLINEIEVRLNKILDPEVQGITKLKIASRQNDGGMYGAYINYLKYIKKERE